VEREYLLDNLVNFSVGDAGNSEQKKEFHKRHLDFLVSKLMEDEFEFIGNSKNFKNHFKFRPNSGTNNCPIWKKSRKRFWKK